MGEQPIEVNQLTEEFIEAASAVREATEAFGTRRSEAAWTALRAARVHFSIVHARMMSSVEPKPEARN